MKIFIIGMPFSGRTTIAKAISDEEKYHYIDASNWIKYTFRDQKEGESDIKYQDEYHSYLTKRMQLNPNFTMSNIVDSIAAVNGKYNIFIIDGIASPKDFIHLFNINEDVVVFLNRIDNVKEFKDSDSISISVIRDYCFWMSSVGLLSKDRWLEYNFKMNSEQELTTVKKLVSKNTVFLVKTFNSVILHLKEALSSLQDHLY